MPFILKLLFLLLIALPMYFLTRAGIGPKKKKAFSAFIVLHGLFLTGMVLTVLNKPAAVLSDEIIFLNTNQNWHEQQQKKAYTFVKDNFLLIDNAFDKQLLPKADQTQGDNTSIAITDRQKLSALFRMLSHDSALVDMVICDIGFDDASPADSLLRSSMIALSDQRKLLISVAGRPSLNEELRFPDNITGDIKEETSERLFTTHRLKRKQHYSLPYRVYSILDDVESTSSCFFNSILKETILKGDSRWKMNTFLPYFFITDEALLANDFNEIEEVGLKLNDIRSANSETVLLRTLGNSVSELGQEDLSLTLAARKQNRKKNIILIGTFSGNEDFHKTAYTELHGPVILLNLIYALHRDQNKISLLLIGICLFFFSFISFWLVNRIVKKKAEPLHSENKEHLPPTSSNPIIVFVKLAFHFIFIEELHYFVLLFAVIFIYHATGVMINGLSLLLYLIAFETFGVYFNRHLPKHSKIIAK